MLLLLALTACLDPETGADDVDPIVTPPAPPAGPAEMATSPDRSEVARAPVRKSPQPAGELIVADCYGYADEGSTGNRFGNAGGLGSKGTGYGGGGGSNRRARPDAAMPSAAPAAAPPVAAAPQEAPPAPPAKTAPKPKASPTSTGEAARSADAAASQVAAPTTPPADLGGGLLQGQPEAAPAAEPIVTSRLTEAGKDMEKKSEDAKVASDGDEERQVQPMLDWGATVWLSNDDSMSLASAQRVLYALKRGVPLRTSEIRPHELLNYFSFDTAEPAPGRVFSVLGGAEQDGDTLTVSLAVKGTTPEREPLDLTLLVDRSCSMSAEGRMDYTRRGLQLMTGQLQPGDRVDLVLFDSSVCTPVQNYVVGRDDPAVLSDALARIRPNSGTNLDAGLQAAYQIQTARDQADVHGRNRRVLLITDALLNEGRVQESLVAQVGKNLEESDIRLSGVGVGRDFNDTMLDKLTENGKGAYVYLGSEAVVDRVFGPGFDALTRTVAHDVHFAIDLPDSLAMEKFYGEEASTNKEDVKPIHYFAGTTQLFLQDLKVGPSGLVRNDPITMRIEYRDAITGEPQVQELRTTVGALVDGDPHNLRKGQALMAFSDMVLARSMGADACGEPLGTYRRRSSAVPGDAEITYVNGLVGDLCHVEMTTVVTRGVQLKLKLDSDQPIASVDLTCGGQHTSQRLTAADQVARFEDVTPGLCTVQLEGNLPMTAEVEVPSTGGDLRCMVRGGRVSCT